MKNQLMKYQGCYVWLVCEGIRIQGKLVAITDSVVILDDDHQGLFYCNILDTTSFRVKREDYKKCS